MIRFHSFGLAILLAAFSSAQDLRLGIIGVDTSHATAFAKTLNDAGSPDHIAGARVVLAFRGGSPDVEQSRTRIDKFANELQSKYGVQFVGQIGEMCGKVDGLLVESVDGRTHLAQVKQALACKKPIFIDKPLASSLSDALEIARLADANHVAWFSASALRFSDVEKLKSTPVKGAMVWSPGPFEPHQQLDLSWYGIHGAEMLYTLMGPGCMDVARITSEGADVMTGRWKDGRLGTVRVDRPYSMYGAIAYRPQNKVDVIASVTVDYPRLVREIVAFMKSGTPPVPNAETLEIMKFLEAAQRSKEQGGKAAALVR